jgi:hypothetical protein
MLMPLNLRSLLGIFGSALLFVAVPAGATTITTTSFASWKASSITGSPTQLDFYPINSSSYNTAAGITLSPAGSSLPFIFTGVDNGSYSLTGDGYGKALTGASDAGAYINIALPAGGENAFFLGVGATASTPATLTLSDGETFSITSTNFGVALSRSVSWMRLSAAPGSQAYINDFLFGTSALPPDVVGGPATPEPATVFLCLSGGGLAFAGSCRKRFADLVKSFSGRRRDTPEAV